ncbi:hypothetical protein CF394_04945 [Tetzosporium hominis]|uniref:Uncharacterized protein n=1 Tax=Tetzosporium hominis TaxID=2020506 RepID=A0A264W501_9BACL|nr:hypothetical protein [Tetzosporium hominis]OZS78635.1 hypothetical protein CF394_04945 [Tetzosporium hominis]
MQDVLITFTIFMALGSPLLFWYLKRRNLALLNGAVVLFAVGLFFLQISGRESTSQLELLWTISVILSLIGLVCSITLLALKKWQLSVAKVLGSLLVSLAILLVIETFVPQLVTDWLTAVMVTAVPIYIVLLTLLALKQFDRKAAL